MNGRNRNGITVALIVALALGIVGFILAMATGSSQRVWEAFLVNLLFWMGIAQGGNRGFRCHSTLPTPAGAESANTAWPKAFVGFLPLSFVLFWGLYLGRHQIFVWIDHPLPEKADWLNMPFLFARDGVALLP